MTEALIAGRTREDAQILSPEWLKHVHHSAEGKLSKPIVIQLAEVDWASHGQLRGLRATLRRILCGCDLHAALADNDAAFAQPEKVNHALSAIHRLNRYLNSDASLSDVWLKDRHAWAGEILQRMDKNDPAVRQAIENSSRKSADVRKELRNLMRSGS